MIGLAHGLKIFLCTTPTSMNYSFDRLMSRAEEIFKRHGGMMRTSQALAAGIHPRTLYRLRDEGVDVLDIGLCGTEEVYFATTYYEAGGGLMVTASV